MKNNFFHVCSPTVISGRKKVYEKPRLCNCIRVSQVIFVSDTLAMMQHTERKHYFDLFKSVLSVFSFLFCKLIKDSCYNKYLFRFSKSSYQTPKFLERLKKYHLFEDITWPLPYPFPGQLWPCSSLLQPCPSQLKPCPGQHQSSFMISHPPLPFLVKD